MCPSLPWSLHHFLIPGKRRILVSAAICERAQELAVPTAAAPVKSAGAPAPRGRPSWSGLLRLSLVGVPVKAYPALSSATTVHFNQLHANCGQRVQYQKRCPQHGPVESAEIVRGYQYAPDQYVVIESDELDKIRPAKDKALVLEQFLGVNQVDPALFAGRSLYLVPDGIGAQHPYGVLVQALQQGRKWAIGRVVLSGTRQLVLVRPAGQVLVMDVLHFPAEVRPAAAWEAELRSSSGTPEELRLASMLIDAAGGSLDWSKCRDTTTEEMTALIEAKIAGRPVAAPAEEPVAVLQLLDALKQSVAAVKGPPKAAPAKPRKPRAQRRATG
jgi:DNA end-binding protein Ku